MDFLLLQFSCLFRVRTVKQTHVHTCMFADIWNQFSFGDSTTQSNDQSGDCISQLPQIAEPIINNLVETSQNCLKYCIIQLIACSCDPQMIELILEGHLKPRDLVAYFLIEHRSFFGVAGFTVGFWKLTRVKWGQSVDLNASRKSYMEL